MSRRSGDDGGEKRVRKEREEEEGTEPRVVHHRSR